MKVELLYATPISILVKAIRKCYDSMEKSDSDWGTKFKLGNKDKDLIKKIINSGHHSTLEHINFNFDLSGYSRALLQEKSRHRIASVSERSTRYCLGQLRNEESFLYPSWSITKEKASKYLVYTGADTVDIASVYALEALRRCIVEGIPNDKAKFCVPDSLKSECVFSINARSLRNWFQLRTSKSALWEIRKLTYLMFVVLPEEYKFLFEDIVTPDMELELSSLF